MDWQSSEIITTCLLLNRDKTARDRVLKHCTEYFYLEFLLILLEVIKCPSARKFFDKTSHMQKFHPLLSELNIKSDDPLHI